MTEELLLKTPDALVRIFELAPGDSGDWHHHTDIDERIVCLSGELHLDLEDPPETRLLRATDRARILARRRHRVRSVAGHST